MTLPEAFEHHARAILADHPALNARWKTISKGVGRELLIPKRDSTGFDVRVEAELDGLYPFAGAWHGAAWELSPSDTRATDTRTAELCVEFLGFIRTLLCEESSLRVHYAGRWPFKWELFYETEDGRQSETCGLLLFNYFGRRSVQEFENHHLPRRYAVAAT